MLRFLPVHIVKHYALVTWYMTLHFPIYRASMEKTGNDNLFIIMYLLYDIAHIFLGEKYS